MAELLRSMIRWPLSCRKLTNSTVVRALLNPPLSPLVPEKCGSQAEVRRCCLKRCAVCFAKQSLIAV